MLCCMHDGVSGCHGNSMEAIETVQRLVGPICLSLSLSLSLSRSSVSVGASLFYSRCWGPKERPYICVHLKDADFYHYTGMVIP